ncbi:MAG TPA: class II aldolase/adducin family protein [Vicinamibacteria bacterium]|nr:class II aldolase/adducin family protein [Vicinamibacteria bacterium]
MTDQDRLKEDICEVGRRLYRNGYIAAMEGNVSIRLSDDEVMSTPAGACKGYLTPDMIVTCDMAGVKKTGTLRVSTEIAMHLTVYRARPDVRAVVHAHPPKSTGFAVAGVPLDRAVLAEVVVTLGCVPLAEYGTPSTEELARSVDRLIRGSDGILLSNHGALTVGKDVFDAYFKMEVVEHFAEISLVSRFLGRERLLPRKEVSRLLDLRQKVYGLEGPPASAESCPVPAEAVEGSGNGNEEVLQLTRGELVQLISDAIREVSS